MDGQTLHTCAKRLALELPFTEHCWPFGPEYDVFKVGGKIFYAGLRATRTPTGQSEVGPAKISVKPADLPQH